MDNTPDLPITHDPPNVPVGTPLTAEQVRMPYAPESVDPRLIAERAAAVASIKYDLLARRLSDEGPTVDPLNLIRAMATGHWRWRRTRDDSIEADPDTGLPVLVGECMSLRAISTELLNLTGMDISHETLRRWWSIVWPDDPPPNQLAYADRGRGKAPAAPEVPPATFLPPPTA